MLSFSMFGCHRGTTMSTVISRIASIRAERRLARDGRCGVEAALARACAISLPVRGISSVATGNDGADAPSRRWGTGAVKGAALARVNFCSNKLPSFYHGQSAKAARVSSCVEYLRGPWKGLPTPISSSTSPWQRARLPDLSSCERPASVSALLLTMRNFQPI